MCGIVGYIGFREAQPLLLDGLRRLEYRGYDSCGLAILSPEGQLLIAKKEGRIATLEETLRDRPLRGRIGIGHTRWATHGKPCDVNAHPHTDTHGTLALVHNGIIENYQKLKARLIQKGHLFRSETDTEVVSHLIADALADGARSLMDAVRVALKQVTGAYALCILDTRDANRLVAARWGAPLIVGIGRGEYFVTSDVAGILTHTREVDYLAEGEIADITREGYTKSLVDGTPRTSIVKTIDWDAEAAEKGGFETYMLKEIHEQPDVLRRTFVSLLSKEGTGLEFAAEPISADRFREISRIHIVSCGTALHAGMVGKVLLDEVTDVHTLNDWSSEFRYRRLKLDRNQLVLLISQSGETADTLASLRIAKSMGSPVLSIVNVRDSTIARESDHVLYILAGPEIGVASTKAYTCQVMVLSVLAPYLGQLRGALSQHDRAALMADLANIPRQIERALETEEQVRRIAARIVDAPSALYLGRGYNFPTALEGALKNKEISYMHAEGYCAGEMKHGPIALIKKGFPVVAVCTNSSTYEKMVSNIKEVGARDAYIITLASEGDTFLHTISDEVIYLPSVREEFSPMVNAVPLQLLAYYVARLRGCDIDKPRNLAKSVTVE